eukprot:symbB.v1.2.016839.t1/scaffold1278.1/size127201/8
MSPARRVLFSSLKWALKTCFPCSRLAVLVHTHMRKAAAGIAPDMSTPSASTYLSEKLTIRDEGGEKGRGYYAARTIPAGELLLREERMYPKPPKRSLEMFVKDFERMIVSYPDFDAPGHQVTTTWATWSRFYVRTMGTTAAFVHKTKPAGSYFRTPCNPCLFFNSPAGCFRGRACTFCHHQAMASASADGRSRPSKLSRERTKEQVQSLLRKLQQGPSDEIHFGLQAEAQKDDYSRRFCQSQVSRSFSQSQRLRLRVPADERCRSWVAFSL